MAKLETTLEGDFNWWLSRIVNGILNGSLSATLEDGSDFISPDGTGRCSVRVFERYSAIGGNRLSLSVTLFSDSAGTLHLSAIASGGSQAMFLKLNTFGETAFLDKLRELL